MALDFSKYMERKFMKLSYLCQVNLEFRQARHAVAHISRTGFEAATLSANLGGEALMRVNVCRRVSYIVLFLIISGKMVKSTTL